MQGIEAITAEIIARAQAAADETVRNAEEASADRLKALDDRLAAENAHRREALADNADNVVQRRLTLAGVEIRMRKLGAKQALIGRAYEDAFGKIAALPVKKYRAVYERLLAKCAEDGAVVTVAAADKERLGVEWLQGVCAQLKVKMSLSDKTSAARGGLIVAGKTSETDLTLETLVDEIRNERGAEVYTVLFGEENNGVRK